MDEHQEAHSAGSISRSLTRLIEAWTFAREAKSRLERLQRSGPPAYRLAEFEDVQTLADYNNQRAEFQRILERLTTKYEDHQREYKNAEEEVTAILPVRKSIVHDYQGEHYSIWRDGEGLVHLRPMSPEEFSLRRKHNESRIEDL
jgi:hypothetical protein